MSKEIFLSAGEISGDFHASRLMKALKELDPSLTFSGNGGRLMQKEGLKLIYKENTTFSAIGLTDSLKFMNIHKKIFKETQNYLLKNKVKAVILIDHQGFNIPLARLCKKLKIPVFYYFPPHVSIWGRWNSPKLARLVDGLFIPFYDDYLIYRKHTTKAFYFGHPLLEVIEEFKFNNEFYEKYKIEKNKLTIGIFPGSRFQEVENLISPMLEALKLAISHYDAQGVISVAHPDYENIIQNAIRKHNLSGKVRMVENEAYSVMNISNVVIAASGTTTLEAVLFKKPVIICYKISPLSFFIGRLLVRKKMIGMPNIILGERVFPELLQKKCDGNHIFFELKKFIEMEELEKKELLLHCETIRNKLGKPPIVKKIAEKILMEIKDG